MLKPTLIAPFRNNLTYLLTLGITGFSSRRASVIGVINARPRVGIRFIRRPALEWQSSNNIDQRLNRFGEQTLVSGDHNPARSIRRVSLGLSAMIQVYDRRICRPLNSCDRKVVSYIYI